MRAAVSILTWQLFLLPWGDGRQSPHLLPWQRGEVAHTGLVYSAATSSPVCEPATKYYEWLPATGQETHLYVNADATHSSQYINIVTHSKMLSTTFICVPVSRQVNKDISIRHLLGGKIVQSASGGHITTYTWILLKTLINPRLHCSIRAVIHLVFLLWVSLFWFWSYFLQWFYIVKVQILWTLISQVLNKDWSLVGT